MPKSLFNNRVDKAVDILKSYLFYVQFNVLNGTHLKNVFDHFSGGQDNYALTMRARSAKWAGRTFDELSTTFMASKIFYPGMPKVDGDLQINFDEFQDTKIINTMTAWMNLIFNSNFSMTEDTLDKEYLNSVEGGATSNYKKDYSCDISVYITTSDTESLVPIYCKFYNCFPKEFHDMSLDTTQNANVKPEIIFKYDYFEYKMNTEKGATNLDGPMGQAFESMT